METTRRLPPSLLEHARAYLAGDSAPVAPRDAATVALLRDGSAGLEVYVLRRHVGMAFAAGMYAFPGGTVDRRDGDRSVAWAGPSAIEWSRRLRCDETQARALVCAAVRETFEESGVLLAGPDDSALVGDVTGEEWERDRAALVRRDLSLSELLDRRGLVLRSDMLHAWAHWVTPEFEPRRYDTRFFVAGIPAGQSPRDVSGEADEVTWLRPADAREGADQGSMAMLPPTYVTLAEMAGYRTMSDAVGAASGRVIATVTPTVEFVGDEGFLVFGESVRP